MKSASPSSYIRRSIMVDNTANKPYDYTDAVHEARINKELKALGVSKYGFWRFDTKFLPHVIHQDEQLVGVVYGHHDEGSAMLAATNWRVIFLDKKPLFVNEDEISYDVVSGVSFSHAGLWTSVTLHTRVKDYTIRTFNQKCALEFVEAIEARCLERNLRRESQYDQLA